jgi:hypothetical protein
MDQESLPTDLKYLLTLVGALFVGLNWLRKFLGSSSEELTPEERARSLREALGLPPDQLPPPPVKQRPHPSAPVSLPRIDPMGPVVRGNPWGTGMNPQRRIKPRAGSRSEETSQAPRRPASEVSLPGTSPVSAPRHTAVEQIALPELEVPEVRQFTTASSQVTAIPFEKSESQSVDAYAIAPKDANRPGHAVQEWLRDPSRLRSAILIQEVLGPPRSLQCIE